MRSLLSRATPAPADPVRRTKRTTQEMIAENEGPGLATTALRTLLALAVAVAVVLGIWFGAAAIEGDEPTPLAPWNAPSTQDVAPPPLEDQ